MTHPRGSEKSCSRCKRTLPLSDFYAHRSRPDGLSSRCADCVRELARLKRERNLDTTKPLPETKHCPACSTVLPAARFYRIRSTSDGLGGYCKACTKAKAVEWQKANPDKKRASDRKQNAKPERRRAMRERLDRWAAENPEKAKQLSLEHGCEYRKRHPERIKAAQKRHRSTPEFKAKRAERNATEYYKMRHRLRESFRRSKLFGYTPREDRLTAEQWKRVLRAFGFRCAYCSTGVGLTIDHLDPVRTGGPHRIGNVVPACSRCNSSKHARPLEEFCASRGLSADAIRMRALL